MSSTSSTKLYECHCDKCGVSTKRKYVNNATIQAKKVIKKTRVISETQTESDAEIAVTSTNQGEFPIVDE
ncbi:hypothetical protein A0J61_11546 [Choanephora cucurbitarum]|uniref:Uncharacterized protein n=1 Tax=Choanephora cucurbitarum TaxID=101091 RepID=A0A1C7MU47_9FUNG|nr:hypothetical protein A0J61_11546 [Choanephora cucurbitarum]